ARAVARRAVRHPLRCRSRDGGVCPLPPGLGSAGLGGTGGAVVKTIRVLLADDHALVRAGVRSLLERLPGIEVVAEAVNAREALALMEKHRPDVTVMDWMMPGLNGLEGTARAASEHPRVRVLMLSMHADEEHVLQALRAGAAGYLVKDAVPAEL